MLSSQKNKNKINETHVQHNLPGLLDLAGDIFLKIFFPEFLWHYVLFFLPIMITLFGLLCSLPLCLYLISKWQKALQLSIGPSFHCLLSVCIFLHFVPKSTHCCFSILLLVVGIWPLWIVSPGFSCPLLTFSWGWPMRYMSLRYQRREKYYIYFFHFPLALIFCHWLGYFQL